MQRLSTKIKKISVIEQIEIIEKQSGMFTTTKYKLKYIKEYIETDSNFNNAAIQAAYYSVIMQKVIN